MTYHTINDMYWKHLHISVSARVIARQTHIAMSTWGSPTHKRYFDRIRNSIKILNSVTVVTCAKFRCDRLNIMWTTALQISLNFEFDRNVVSGAGASYWLVACRYQDITWTNVDLSLESVAFTWDKFHKWSGYYSINRFDEYTISITVAFSGSVG